MDASTLFKRALAACGLALAGLLLAAPAVHAGPITYRAGFFSGSIPQTWELNETNPDGSFTLAGYAASAGGLSGFANVRRDQFTPQPRPVAEIIVDDIIINWTGAGPAPASTVVRLATRLTGSFTGDIANGNGSALVGLNLSGQGVTSVGGGVSLPQSFSFNSQDYVGGVDASIVISRLAPLGVPLTVTAQLSVTAMNLSGLFLSNFGNTLSFDPQSVFDLDPGFTASSVSWGLVDNALPALLPVAAPAPAAFWLFVPALASLGLVARRRG